MKRNRGRIAVMVWAVMMWIGLGCLAACSEQVYIPSSGNTDEVTTAGPVWEIPSGNPFENAPHVLYADFLNTGDSDAILLRADDTVILVDTGESDDYPAISRRLNELGISEINYLILTHFDNDHIGTVSQILQAYTVEHVYMPAYVRESVLYRRMMNTLETVSRTILHRVTDEVRIELPYGSMWINPTRLYAPEETLGSDDSHSLEENNYSLITSINFGERSLLLMGDAEQDRILEFMEVAGKDAVYDVIKIPHHGGYDKALSDLLRQSVGLRYCMIHVGEASHAKDKLMTAVRSVGAAAYLTCNGDIRFSTDGVSMLVEQK